MSSKLVIFAALTIVATSHLAVQAWKLKDPGTLGGPCVLPEGDHLDGLICPHDNGQSQCAQIQGKAALCLTAPTGIWVSCAALSPIGPDLHPVVPGMWEGGVYRDCGENQYVGCDF